MAYAHHSVILHCAAICTDTDPTLATLLAIVMIPIRYARSLFDTRGTKSNTLLYRIQSLSSTYN
jgi:hypothetical protein